MRARLASREREEAESAAAAAARIAELDAEVAQLRAAVADKEAGWQAEVCGLHEKCELPDYDFVVLRRRCMPSSAACTHTGSAPTCFIDMDDSSAANWRPDACWAVHMPPVRCADGARIRQLEACGAALARDRAAAAEAWARERATMQASLAAAVDRNQEAAWKSRCVRGVIRCQELSSFTWRFSSVSYSLIAPTLDADGDSAHIYRWTPAPPAVQDDEAARRAGAGEEGAGPIQADAGGAPLVREWHSRSSFVTRDSAYLLHSYAASVVA